MAVGVGASAGHGEGILPAPASTKRTVRVAAEARLVATEAQDRTVTVPASDRDIAAPLAA
jgi:hypothetical protein